MSTSTLVPHIENSEKKDHEVPAVTENGMVWKSPSMAIFCGGTGSGKVWDGVLLIYAAVCDTSNTSVTYSVAVRCSGLDRTAGG